MRRAAATDARAGFGRGGNASPESDPVPAYVYTESRRPVEAAARAIDGAARRMG